MNRENIAELKDELERLNRIMNLLEKDKEPIHVANRVITQLTSGYAYLNDVVIGYNIIKDSLLKEKESIEKRIKELQC